jgi:hypothetical protein
MSTNLFFLEQRDNHVRFAFVPEDNVSTVYIFDAFRE